MTPRDSHDEMMCLWIQDDAGSYYSDCQRETDIHPSEGAGPLCFHCGKPWRIVPYVERFVQSGDAMCPEIPSDLPTRKRWVKYDDLLALLRAPETQPKVMRCVVCKRNWCPDSYTEACPLCWLDSLKKSAHETQERGWQPISTAPKDGTPVALYTRGGSLVKAKWDTPGDFEAWVACEDDEHPWNWDDGVCWESNSYNEPSDPPVFWMPLPSPPAQAEDSQ